MSEFFGNFDCEAGKSEERGSLERLSSYQYLGRAGSVIKTTSPPGTEVSVDEIRSAAATASSSDRYYPPSLHAPLISSPEPDPNGKFLIQFVPNAIQCIRYV